MAPRQLGEAGLDLLDERLDHDPARVAPPWRRRRRSAPWTDIAPSGMTPPSCALDAPALGHPVAAHGQAEERGQLDDLGGRVVLVQLGVDLLVTAVVEHSVRA